jgi:hypothetical protein
METILVLLYLSVYLSVGGIIAELSLNFHDKEELDVIRNRKAVYSFITSLWPLMFVMFIWQFYKDGGKR